MEFNEKTDDGFEATFAINYLGKLIRKSNYWVAIKNKYKIITWIRL